MKALRLALTINCSYLDKLRVRLAFCRRALASINTDYRKQYGPYAGYWDEWIRQINDIQNDLLEQVKMTATFLDGLHDFAATLGQKKRLTKSDVSYLREVTKLATDKITEQIALMENIDLRLKIHQQLTNKLLLVEAIEDLNDES